MAKLVSNTRIYGTATIDTRLFINGAIGVTSTNTGVLQVAGGIGVWGGMFVSGQLTATEFVGNLTGTVTTATQANNLNGGILGQIPYQTAANTTAFIGTGSQNSILVMGANTASFITSSTVQVGFAANLLAGAAGSLPYQSGANATAMLALSGTSGALLTAGASAPAYITQVTARNGTGNTTTASGQSLVVSNGGLGVIGNSHFADNVNVRGDLSVNGATTFNGNVTFSGSATFVYSTNTFYTDNIINIHTPAGGVANTWTTNDGKDIGLTFHNFVDGYDNNGFIGWKNDSGYLEWFSKGSHEDGNVFTGTQYGIFRTGGILLENTTGVHSTQTGALQVKGGVGIAGGLFVGGSITATNFFGTFSGTANQANNLNGGLLGQISYQTAPNTTAFIGTGTSGSILQMGANTATFVTTASIYVNSAVNANTLRGGTTGQLVYQSAANTTAFAGPGTAGQILVSAGAAAPVYTNTASIYVNNAVTATNIRAGTAGQIPYQSAPGVTAFAGPGTAGQVLTSAGTGAPTYVNTTTLYVGRAVVADSATGSAGSVSAQLQTNNAQYFLTFVDSNNAAATAELIYTTSSIFVNPATGQVGVGLINTSSRLTVAGRIESTTDPAGEGGQVVLRGRAFYRWSIDNFNDSFRIIREDDATETNGITPLTIASNTNATVLIGTSTPNGGEKFNVNGGGFFNGIVTATTFVGNLSGNIVGGTAGQLVYQSAADTTAFAGPGNAGEVLTSGGTGTPTYVSTTTLYVGRAVSADSASGTSNFANNINGGILGQIPYQTAPNSTAFIGTGTNGSILQMGANTATFVTTASIYVNSAVNANTLRGGTAGQLVYQSAAGVTAFAGPGTAGQILVSAGTSAPTYTNTSSVYVGFANSSNNVRGGILGQIPYQSAANTTLFIGTGTQGSILQMGANTATFVTTASIYVNNAVTATNVRGGTAGQLVYQSAPGITAYAGPGNAGEVLTSGGTGAPTYLSTSSLYVGRALLADSVNNFNTSTLITTAVNLNGGELGQIPYQLAAGSTAFIGTGTQGSLLQMGANTATFVTTANIYVNSAVNSQNVYGGSAGSILYQSAANATTSLGIGANNSILVSNGSVPSWTTSPTIGGNLVVVGNLTVQGTTVVVDSTVTNVSDPIITVGGAAGGALPVADDGKDRGIAFIWTGTQAGLNTARTGFFGFDRSTLYFTFITSATITNEVAAPAGGTTKGAIDANLAGGTAGQLVYQSAADTTAFAGPGTAGQVLTSGGTGAPTYVSTTTLYVGRAVVADSATGGAGSATNLAGGTAGQVPYQTGAGATSFFGPGTAGQILVSAGTSAPTYTNTGSIYINRAVLADSATAVNAIRQPGNAIYFPAFVDSNNAAATAELVYTTSSFVINPSTGRVGVNSPTPISALQVGGDVRISGISTVTNSTGVHSTATGALQVIGGVGIGGGLFVGGVTTSTNTTNAVSTTTGALQVAGGAGIGGDAYVGGDIYTRGLKVIPLNIQEFVATGGQTTFTISGGYAVGTAQVFANGVQLGSAAYVASNGSTVVLNTARVAGDIVRVISGGTSTQQNNAQAFSIAMSVALGS